MDRQGRDDRLDLNPGGTGLFGGLDPASLALGRTRLIDAEGVAHLNFRVARPG